MRRLSRKKSHQGAQQQRSELSLFQSGRTFLTGRDEIENDRGDNRMPGYTGHVPKVSERQCGPKTARAKGAKRERSLTPQETDPFHRPPLRCQANGAGTKGDNRNPADKSLLADNYRHNVVGYTGHIK